MKTMLEPRQIRSGLRGIWIVTIGLILFSQIDFSVRVNHTLPGHASNEISPANTFRVDTLAVDNNATIGGATFGTGAISPAPIAGPTTINNYAPTGFATAQLVLQNVTGGGTSPVVFSGLAGGAAGRFVYLVNTSTDSTTFQLAPQNAGSSAANRFTTTLSAGTNVQVSPGGAALLWYDIAISNWRIVAVVSNYTISQVAGNWSINGLLTSAAANLGGTNSFTSSITPPAISGTLNDYTPTNVGTSSTIHQDVSAAATITGLSSAIASGSTGGRVLFLENIATTPGDTITLTNEGAGSTAVNRFTLPNAQSVVIQPGGGVLLRYRSASSRWYVETPSGLSSSSGTTNLIPKYATANSLTTSSLSDDGTTFEVNSTAFTVTEASGNTSIGGTCSIGGALNMNSHLIDNVTDPASAQDAATKHYVDSRFNNVDPLIFGSGTDGACSFDGSTSPVCGATLSGSVYTMGRTVWASGSTIATSVEVKEAGFPYYDNATLTLTGTAKITDTGATASGSSGGAARANAWFGANVAGGAAGAAGGTSTGLCVPFASTQSGGSAGLIGGAGGTGNTCTGGGGGGGNATNAGNAGGVFTVKAATGCGDIQAMLQHGTFNAAFSSTIQFGTGGGGGGNGGGTGGGGGAAGGNVFVAARVFAGSGTIEARGGNGAAGTGGGGGGGGGAGGYATMIYETNTGTVTTVVTGGTHGAGAGGGGNGGDGGSCLSFKFNLSGDGT